MAAQPFEEGMVTASAPPEVDDGTDNTPKYPVLSQPGQQQYQQQYQPQQPQQAIYGQQPQQVIYQQPPPQNYANSQQQSQQMIYQQQQQDESKQLDIEISSKFDAVIQLITNKKTSILNKCTTANNEQKKDILEQLQHITNGINEVEINPNIKPKPIPIPIPQQQQQPIVIIQQQPQPQQANIKYISDTWNTSIAHPHLLFNPSTNSVCRTGKRGEWFNCFGNQVITKGQYKKWEIKIIPKFEPKTKKDYIADVVVGVVNSKKITNRAGGFWLGPMLGYGYYGFSGKKFHTNRKGKPFSDKFNINDTISIEVNMQQFQLSFLVNGQRKGKPIPIDARLSYVLAAALSTPDYDLQIC